MAFDAFLVVKDAGKAVKVKGETQDAFFKNLGAFEISEFSFGAENTLNITSATGGAGAGKATFKVDYDYESVNGQRFGTPVARVQQTEPLIKQ